MAAKKNKDYQERINRVLIYIQDHFNEKITLDDLSRVSHFSAFHFHRIFSAFTGESLQAYLRRLKIQNAAAKLLYTDHDVTEIALAAGFETPSSFSTAFKKQMGMTPNFFRKKGTENNFANACSKQINIIGENQMKVIIKTIEEEKVIFIRESGNYFTAAPNAWKKMNRYAKENGLIEKNIRLIGIAHDDPAVTPEEHWRFDACIAGLKNPSPSGEVGVQSIAGGKYAVFEHIGSYENLGVTYRKIFGEWYPNSNVTLRNAPTFSHYTDRTFAKNYGEMTEEEKENCVTHVYVPIG